MHSRKVVLASEGRILHFASDQGGPSGKSESLAKLMAGRSRRAASCLLVGGSPDHPGAAAVRCRHLCSLHPRLASSIADALAMEPDLRVLDSVIEQVLREARA